MSTRRGGKKGAGGAWSEEEHLYFLMGLLTYGRGDWRSIAANYVQTRTPSQIASHAQKYYLRQKKNADTGLGSASALRGSVCSVLNLSTANAYALAGVGVAAAPAAAAATPPSLAPRPLPPLPPHPASSHHARAAVAALATAAAPPPPPTTTAPTVRSELDRMAPRPALGVHGVRARDDLSLGPSAALPPLPPHAPSLAHASKIDRVVNSVVSTSRAQTSPTAHLLAVIQRRHLLPSFAVPAISTASTPFISSDSLSIPSISLPPPHVPPPPPSGSLFANLHPPPGSLTPPSRKRRATPPPPPSASASASSPRKRHRPLSPSRDDD